MYRITLGNGKILSSLSINGSNFVSQTPVTEEDFRNGLSSIKIEFTGKEDDERVPGLEGVHEHMKLFYCRQFPGSKGYFIGLADYTPDELKEMKLESRLSYLEMMQEE